MLTKNRTPTLFVLFPQKKPSLCKGDGADRCQWQIKGGGGRENNERTRGHLCRRRARRLFFRAMDRLRWAGCHSEAFAPKNRINTKAKHHPTGNAILRLRSV